MQPNVVNFPAVSQSCGCCDWADCCVNRGIHPNRKDDASKTIAYRRNELLFRQGDTLDSFYFLRSGSAKTVVTTLGGSEQITGFLFPGDLIGFDGIVSGRHQSSCYALETSGVCTVPLRKLKSESTGNPQLWDELIRTLAANIGEKQNYSLMLNQKSVHARFASFLCYLSGKYASRGCSGDEFNLSMSRQDIANYLSMAVETLSRLIAEFQRKNMIDVNRRFVRITDVRALRELAHHECPAQAGLG